MKEILQNYVKNPSNEGYSRAVVEALEASHNSDELKHLINIVTGWCGTTALHFAAGNGHESVARLLIEKGAIVNNTDKDGYTALHKAAKFGRENIARLLIERGAIVNKANSNGTTALRLAADDGYESIARLLIEKGAEVNKADNNGNTVLHWAARNGHESIVRLLINNGAEVNKACNYGDIALHWAAMMGRENIVRLLIEKGAEVNKANNDGDTALQEAARKGATLLHGALKNCFTETVRLLLLCGGKLGTGRVSEEDAAKINETIKVAQSRNDKIEMDERALFAESISQDSFLNPQNGFVVGDVLGLVKLFMNNNISPTTLPVEHASRLREQGAKTAAGAAIGD